MHVIHNFMGEYMGDPPKKDLTVVKYEMQEIPLSKVDCDIGLATELGV